MDYIKKERKFRKSSTYQESEWAKILFLLVEVLAKKMSYFPIFCRYNQVLYIQCLICFRYRFMSLLLLSSFLFSIFRSDCSNQLTYNDDRRQEQSAAAAAMHVSFSTVWSQCTILWLLGQHRVFGKPSQTPVWWRNHRKPWTKSRLERLVYFR